MQYQVQVKGEFGGSVGGWRPAITGTLNQSGRSDESASTFDSVGKAEDAASLVIGEGASVDDVRVIEIEDQSA